MAYDVKYQQMWIMGYEAYENGIELSGCVFSSGSGRWDAWCHGWVQSAVDELRQQLESKVAELQHKEDEV